jgi:hypothetical protein
VVFMNENGSYRASDGDERARMLFQVHSWEPGLEA